MDTIYQRLEDLANQPLLPQKHVDYLYKLSREGINPRVIFDVGACVLHWASVAKRVWPNSNLICFEAMHEVLPVWERRAVCGFSAVLSDVDDKEVDFFQNTYHPGGNSYYRENKEHNPEVDLYFNEAHRTKRHTITLDTLVNRFNLPQPNFIKMDVQGAELDVLKGAKLTLVDVQYLILELQHVEYNKGAPNCQEVIEYLDSQGFDLVERFVATNVDGDYFFKRS